MADTIRLRHRPQRYVIVHGLSSVCIQIIQRILIDFRTQRFGIQSIVRTS